jgi:glutamate N-acetyltransferase / amino-acid N-acetyltransferase
MASNSTPISPLAPKHIPELPEIKGVRFATAEAGVKYKNRRDVFMAVMDEGTTVAGVFTRSKCPSATVDWCRTNLAQGKARVLVVNSGNANAFTGLKGKQTVELTADIAAKSVECKPQQVFLASTGVIGEPLDATKFDGVLQSCATRLATGPWIDAAKAIMTTDTFPKLATAKTKIDGVDVVINGIAKGAGMIAPDMATMLSFVFTDAAIEAPALQAMLSAAVKPSFNAVTVDSDMSTSDTLMLFATGYAGNAAIKTANDPRLKSFKKALNAVLLDLAKQVAKDGEGARKFITVTVEGAVSKLSARRIAFSVANSPLVKTAVAGEDANWGRVVMAVGKAGEPASRDLLSIYFGPYRVAHLGTRDNAYDETIVSNYMKQDEIEIRVELGLGKSKDRVFTCDLTKAYVEINGDYRS